MYGKQKKDSPDVANQSSNFMSILIKVDDIGSGKAAIREEQYGR